MRAIGKRTGTAMLATIITALATGGTMPVSAATTGGHVSKNRAACGSGPAADHTRSTCRSPCRRFAGDNQAAANCLLAQPLADIDRLYATLRAGPMPGWRKPGHGTFRCVWLEACGGEAGVAALNAVVPLLWGGKTFFTHAKGGWLWNRPAPLENPALSDPVDGNNGVLI